MCGVFAILALVGLVWWFINAVSLTERLPMTGNEPEDYMEEEQVRQQIEELKNTIRTGRNSLRSRHKIESPAHTSDRRSPNPRDEWGSPNISDNSSDGFRSPESVKETEKVKSSSADIPMKRDSEKQHQPPQFLSRNGAITPRGVLGEPMYGQSPVRRPLTSDENLIRNPVPLIVGGTDGSGTRGVVALLQRLNVIMVVEDLGTLDVHGTPYMASGGWPHVVRPVVEWAGGANYDASAAPESLRTSTLEALGNLKTKMESVRSRLRGNSRFLRSMVRNPAWNLQLQEEEHKKKYLEKALEERSKYPSNAVRHLRECIIFILFFHADRIITIEVSPSAIRLDRSAFPLIDCQFSFRHSVTTVNRQAAKKDRNKQRGQVANYVSWGFKAPVSMLLVPFFQEAWGRAKFLHVVRDGRDIAFSGNQTPVSKFYDQTFGPGSKERQIESAPLKAIKMWSVWNSGLYQWATRRAAGGASHTDYLMLHVEDLIDPAAKVRVGSAAKRVIEQRNIELGRIW